MWRSKYKWFVANPARLAHSQPNDLIDDFDFVELIKISFAFHALTLACRVDRRLESAIESVKSPTNPRQSVDLQNGPNTNERLKFFIYIIIVSLII